MEDGLDTYCVACNQRRREDRKTRTEPITIDKFELWKRKRQNNAAPPESAERQKMKELNCRISAAISDAELTLGRSIKVDPIELSRKLLMRQRFVCTLTGLPVTIECFLAHHSLRFTLVTTHHEGTLRDAVQISCTNTIPRV